MLGYSEPELVVSFVQITIVENEIEIGLLQTKSV